MTTSNHRVAIWCAVSSKPQAAEDKDSLRVQEHDGRAWADSIQSPVVRIYSVPGHSRDYIHYLDAEQDIPAYRALREDAENGMFDVLWCRARDRLGRTDALIAQVEAIVQAAAGRVYSAAVPTSLDGKQSRSDLYIGAFERAQAQADNEDRVDKHAMGIRRRIERGLPASHWPHGYRAVRDDKGHTTGGEFVAGEIEAVQIVTRLYLDGLGYDAIAQRLNASPYRPRRARRWLVYAVRDIIQSDFYAGFVHFGDITNAEPSERYPLVWDADTHAEIVRERARRYQGGKPPASPVTSIVRCRRCRHPLVSTRVTWHTDTPYRIFRCWVHLQKRLNGHGCHPNRIHENVVIDALEAFIAHKVANPGTAGALVESERPGPSRSGMEAEAARAREWIVEIEAKQDRITDKIGMGVIDDASAARVTSRLRAEMADAKTAQKAALKRLAALPSPAALQRSLDGVLELASLREVPVLLARQRLLQAGFRVWVEEGEIVEIEWGVFA